SQKELGSHQTHANTFRTFRLLLLNGASQSLNSERGLCFYRDDDDETQNYEGWWLGHSQTPHQTHSLCRLHPRRRPRGLRDQEEGPDSGGGSRRIRRDASRGNGEKRGRNLHWRPHSRQVRPATATKTHRKHIYDALIGGRSVNGRACS